MNIGKSLRRLQRELRISNRELADHLDVKEPQISKWRNSEDMKASTVVSIANYMGVSVLELLQDQ
jgi:transcriptional regulator with XRE-family HTH domain